MALHDHPLVGRVSPGHMETGGEFTTHTHTHTQLGSIELTLSFSLSLSPGTLQFASNASRPSGRMVSGSAWHQGGTLSHTLPLLTPLQAGHCEEGA